MLYLFHRASSFVPSVSTCLATQDSPNVLSTAFPGSMINRVAMLCLGIVFFQFFFKDSGTTNSNIDDAIVVIIGF